MIPPEQKAKLEEMATKRAEAFMSSGVAYQSYIDGAQAAWDMAVQYATEKERERIANLMGYLTGCKYCATGETLSEIINRPEQKEEGAIEDGN